MKFTAFTRVRHGLLVLAASLGLVFGVSAVPAQAAEPTFTYLGTVEIRVDHSGQCLEVADWSTANGAAVRQWPCTGGANQKWHRFWRSNDLVGSSYYVNVNSNKCLEIGGWGRNNGATANQWDCHYGLNQLFHGGDGILYMDYSYVQGKCLEIADWSTQPGARARLWDCHYGDNQGFRNRSVAW
ncbi:RICIN domain-containing protein [Streptomyces sp. TX20-6-3]|uniref:RICIN domain-containing protein n=1 Tax=Streptomyces sp. TX20-6-3 TaxID=3028705 RepID=UPI0029B90DAD|nr:RICIN domain-containing protein [Streptomyces sp. TX20-6-3]MDX2558492.1 RICIN domain-containing protein [Streptomyces sp. TX20-6-3]